MLVLAMAFPISASETPLVGDVNGDGKIAITDVTALIDYLLTNDASLIVMENADVNPDGKVAITDVTALIDILLAGETPEPDNDYVDLGLPSGTLWATRNVGAENPEDCGDYYSWGEVETKSNYAASYYKWCHVVNSIIKLTKYCTKAANGYENFVDSLVVMEPEDDVARLKYPNGQMPSPEQLTELIDTCTWAWTEVNGMNGYMVTGPNGNSMFLPAAGYRTQTSIKSVGVTGNYWLNSIQPIAPLNARKINFSATLYNLNGSSRQLGYTIRAVRVRD